MKLCCLLLNLLVLSWSEWFVVGVSSFQQCSPLAPPCRRSAQKVHDRRHVVIHRGGGGDFVFMTPENKSVENPLTTGASLQEDSTTAQNMVSMEGGGGESNPENKSGQRKVVLLAAVGVLSCVALAAKFDLLLASSYIDALILRDVGSTVLTAVLGYAFVKTCTYLASKEVLEPRDSRKIIHTLSAPLFILFWPIFSSQPGARCFAAVVPLINAMRLFVAGSSGVAGDEAELANAVSRSGNVKEALGGPFIYVIIMFISILAFWRDSVSGVMALSSMAAGDGMADLMGRRFGKSNKWPFAPDKSMAGSLAFFVSSTACAIGLVVWLQHCGSLSSDVAVGRIAAIMAACTAIELVPLGDDNWTVPLSAAILSMLLLQ